MRRVLHISANNYPELAEFHFTKRIWLELAKGADEYHVLARGKTNHTKHFREGNLFLHLVPSWGNRERSFLLSSLYLFPLIKKHKINILLAQSPLLGGLSASLASRLWKIPMMVELHGEHYFTYFKKGGIVNKVMSLLTSISLRQATRIRALNVLMANRLQLLGFDKATIVPNRVDTNLFSPPKQMYKLKQPVRLISVGRFVPEKNYLPLLDMLANWHQPFLLTLVGGGPQKKEMEKAVNRLGLRDKVTLVDWLPQQELVLLMTQSDVYIQSSISEALPRTLLEAMALGMPCVTTDAGCIAGTIVHEVTGMIVSKNLADFLPTLDAILGSEEKRRNLGAAARDEIHCHYEWNHCFQMYREALYGM
jgi:D-inositol-3-phosphate glycosyltransferase